MEIRPFLGADADPSELKQRYELYAEDRRSVFPGFPIQAYEQYVAAAAACPPSTVALSEGLPPVAPPLQWSAWQGERLIGSVGVSLVEEDGTLVAVPRIEVAADHRRRGVGTALLHRLVSAAQARGCTTLVADAVRIGSAGALWANRVGFRTTQIFSWQMLHIPDIEPARWQLRTPAGYRLERWTAATPEPLVAAFARARNAIADSPLGDTSLVHPTWTVERLRRVEAEIAADGDTWHCVVAMHERTGDVAAFTELLRDPVRPALSWQRDTAVVRAHRGLGLARTVKAAMLRWLSAEVPGLDRVVTSTAAENTAMRRVNEQVGYLPYAEIGMLEAAPAEIEAKLSIPGARRSQQRRPLLQHLADFEA
ncbi:GNAT family N-acetyltransferase [Actinospica robiniae]|uniref:GNAT family N-acetyltransferase n=1 Tax=Actinospica robiniae TaxID=304901 RepID=UPI000425F6F9|nr:GNAT family N-acetyltransferase [Actinospica robiniae]